jgi:AsmA protein
MASTEPISGPDTNRQARPRHRRLLWTLLALLLLLLLVLTPPLVNVNRLRRRIAAGMSASLGRPVHLDRVRLHLLPVPGFTLENLVVSEDPAFGYEPTIRANTVEVTLRPSSLWRRQVEFSTIRFINPSLNLVRNPQGRWNLESLLMHAASVQSAPTAQPKAGPAPRFPYMEARNARVNLKLGQVKQPFSLIDADFALWLPAPQQWNIRVQARPARTDSNVSDAGTVRLEGSLDRAAQMDDIGIHLQASWHDAQLGEASRMLAGSDAGWRGTVNLDAALTGTLRRADLTAEVHANDLRRADFLPPQLLDVSLHCAALADTLRATTTQLHCTLPVDEAGPVTLDSPALDLDNPRAATTALSLKDLPLPELMKWARLFSLRIPADLNPPGTVTGELDWVGTPAPGADRTDAAAFGWSGGVTATLPLPAPPRSADPSTDNSGAAPRAAPPPQVFTLVVPRAPNPQLWLQLQPTPLHLSAAATPASGPALLTLSALAGGGGYTLSLSGIATPEQVVDLSQLFPPFSEGVAATLPPSLPALHTPIAISLTCSRQWPAPQTCVSAPPAPAPRTRKTLHRGH